MHRLISVVAAVSAIVLGFQAQLAAAHHSGAMYDYTKSSTVEGVVKEFAWTNPHVTLWVIDSPKDGQVARTWFFQSTSPGNMTRRGWTRNTFKTGDRVKVTFHPLRDGVAGGNFVSATLLDTGQQVTTEEEPGADGKPNPQ